MTGCSGALRRRTCFGFDAKVASFALLGTICFLLAACEPFGALNNPVDPAAAAYHGYQTVERAEDMKAEDPVSDKAIYWPVFTVSNLKGAGSYHLQVSASASDFSGALVYDKDGFASNKMAVGEGIDAVPGTKYYWKVSASSKPSTWTPTASFVAYSIGIEGRLPANNGTGEAKLSWRAPLNCASAQVQLSKDEATLAAATPIAASATAYDATALCQLGETWYWRVRPLNSANVPGFWSPAFKLSTGAPKPVAPTGLAVSAPTQNSLTLSWNAVADATSYQLHRDTVEGGDFATQVYTGTALTYTDSGLTASTKYYYKVKASNASGAGDFSLAVSGTTSDKPVVPAASLVGEWLLDGDAKDSSGKGNDGTVTNATYKANRLGTAASALSLSGTGYVSFGDVHDFGSSDFSISAWFNADIVSGYHKIVNKNCTSSGSPANNGYQLRVKDGTLEFGACESTATWKQVDKTGIAAGTWYHVAAVRSGKSLNMYVNGASAGTIDTGTVLNIGSNMPLMFGALTASGSETFVGLIDDVRVYSGALTQADVTALYTESGGSGTTTTTTTTTIANAPSGSYRFYRMTVTAVTTGGGQYANMKTAAIDEIEYYNADTSAYMVNNMTSAATPAPRVVSGVCALGFYTNNQPWKAFDGTKAPGDETTYAPAVVNGNASGADTTLPFSVTIDYGAGNNFVMSKYRIVASDYSDVAGFYDPISWTIDGSNDGSAWTLLDSRTLTTTNLVGRTGTYPATFAKSTPKEFSLLP